ncbi:hypothetical protein D3C72_2340360 [compost metagenome]
MRSPPIALGFAKQHEGIGMQDVAIELAAYLLGQTRQQATASRQYQFRQLLVARRAAKQLHIAPYLKHERTEMG